MFIAWKCFRLEIFWCYPEIEEIRARRMDATSITTRTQIRVFTLLCAFAIIFWWRPLVATIDLALASDAYTHILLIVPMSVALIYFDSKHSGSRVRPFAPRPSLLPGASLLILSLVIGNSPRWILAGATESARLSLGMLALVICWMAGVILCFGVGIFRSYLFPLCLLFLVVPLPQSALNRTVEFLQYQSAVAARLLFQLARIPVAQDGILLSIPGLDIEVAQECSSIRSSLMLVVTTLILAHLFLRSWWGKAALIAAVVPLSVAKNGLRIFTIAVLGTRVDPGFLTGTLHHKGGIIFYGFAVALVIVLLLGLRRAEFRVSS